MANHLQLASNDCHEVVKESLERASVRILSRRYGAGKRQIMNMVHKVVESTKDSVWIAKHFPLNWSGTLVFDGKVVRVYDRLSKMWMNKKTWLCGIDYGAGDLPHYDLGDDETKIDLVIYFRTLKEIGYPLRVLVCDGNADIPSAARHVFGESIIVQLCTRHFVESLKRHARDQINQSNAQRIICTIQRIIEADDLETAGKFLEQLKQVRGKTKIENELTSLFKKHAAQLTAHLLHPELDIPHTSNDIENLFRQLNLRLKTIGRFYQWQYARDYLKAWALLRRLTKFTDCRNGRRWRNGKAPIEIAGADIAGIDCLKL